MSDLLVVAGIGVVAFLVYKKFKKPCCASCANGGGCAGAGSSTPSAMIAASPNTQDNFAIAPMIGSVGESVLGTITHATTAVGGGCS